MKSVSDSVKIPLNYWENNINGTINLLKVMETYNFNNIVFCISATVYKAQNNKLINEDDICEPLNPCGNNELTIEGILKDIYQSQLSKWRIASLRYFNPVGVHKSGLLGENPLGIPNNLYLLIKQLAIVKIKGIKIFGSDW